MFAPFRRQQPRGLLDFVQMQGLLGPAPPLPELGPLPELRAPQPPQMGLLQPAPEPPLPDPFRPEAPPPAPEPMGFRMNPRLLQDDPRLQRPPEPASLPGGFRANPMALTADPRLDAMLHGGPRAAHAPPPPPVEPQGFRANPDLMALDPRLQPPQPETGPAPAPPGGFRFNPLALGLDPRLDAILNGGPRAAYAHPPEPEPVGGFRANPGLLALDPRLQAQPEPEPPPEPAQTQPGGFRFNPLALGSDPRLEAILQGGPRSMGAPPQQPQGFRADPRLIADDPRLQGERRYYVGQDDYIPDIGPDPEPSGGGLIRGAQAAGTRPQPQPETAPGGTYFERVAALESGGQNIQNGMGGTAFGPYQFTASTWADLVDKYGPSHGLTIEGRYDPAQQETAMRLFTEDNRGHFRTSLGREPDDGELYAQHVLGRSGGVAFARALERNPNMPMEELVREVFGSGADEVLRLNPNFRGVTVGDMRRSFARAMPGEGGLMQRSIAALPEPAMAQAPGGGLLQVADASGAGGLLGPEPEAVNAASGAPSGGGLLGDIGGLLGEGSYPLMMLGLQMMANSGPSLTPRGLFEGAPEAVAAGIEMGRETDEGGFRPLTMEQQNALGLPADQRFQIGPDGRIHQIGGGGVNVNIGDQPRYGTIPPGHRLIEDPDTGAAYMELIPGSPQEREQAEAVEAQERATQTARRYAAVATEDIGRALEIIRGSGIPATGFSGWVSSAVPGTPAYNLSSILDTLTAYTGFERLQAIRDASTTGGGVGALSDTELQLMASSMGSLSQLQSAEEVEYNLARLHDAIVDSQYPPGEGPARLLPEIQQRRERAATSEAAQGGLLAAEPTPPHAPPVGAIEDGYRFLGGDPANPENWEPVQ